MKHEILKVQKVLWPCKRAAALADCKNSVHLKLEELNVCNAEMVKWIKHEEALFDLTQIKGVIMFQCADCNMTVFKTSKSGELWIGWNNNTMGRG